MRNCYLLIPRDSRFSGLLEDEEGCLLQVSHFGNHLSRLKNGKYISWGGDGCDKQCDYCGDCFCWTEIKEKQALEIVIGTQQNISD